MNVIVIGAGEGKLQQALDELHDAGIIFIESVKETTECIKNFRFELNACHLVDVPHFPLETKPKNLNFKQRIPHNCMKRHSSKKRVSIVRKY